MDYIILALLAVVCLLVIGQLFLSRRSPLETATLSQRFDSLDKAQEKLERTIRDEIKVFRDEMALSARQDREEARTNSAALKDELTKTQKNNHDSTVKVIAEMGNAQKEDAKALLLQVSKLTESIEVKLENLRKTVEDKLKQIQEDNAKQLEQVRATVDEKLQGTLEKRLGESFKQVSERLEQVHKGLGEMQSLATGVGDLKKVLTNVKVRGTWGEIQLGNLLEQVLSPEQYESNVRTKHDSNDAVEFAIKLPGREKDSRQFVWLPVDSKFPTEDYQRLLNAQEAGDAEAAAAEGNALEARIKACAKDISSKYIDPPHTTDFAVMFLPVEGLYAEVLRRPGLVESLQHDYHLVVAGPTTFAALLNSLQMGFHTLAIEKRSSEVWALLGAVKTQFGKFGELLDKVKKNIELAGKSIDGAATKTRTIERKLRSVEELPVHEATDLIGDTEEIDENQDGQDTA